MSRITVIDFWFVWIQNLRNKMNLIRCLLRKNALVCCNVWNFLSNAKQTLRKVRLNSCRADVLHYCERHLIGLDLNFDTILTYKQSFFYGKIYSLYVLFGIFLKCKIGLKRSKTKFMQNWSCITVIGFWWSRSWTLIEYCDINCYLLWKIFPILLPHLEFFSKIWKGP